MTTTAANPSIRQAPRDDQDALVQCLGLSKVFKDFWYRSRVRAVDRIDLTIRRGEVFGLLGPNGSGKSTTIKMILGLLRPTAGRIAVFGRHPEDVAVKHRIGYLPEETYLYRFLNARETLEYYGRLFHQNGATRAQRTDMLLEMVGLDNAARRPIGEYSKGMQRRIGLAQALINDPELLILDEPTTGLDPIGTRQIKDLIVELARRGKTVLLCSHLLADVEDVCDRVAIMFGGKVRAHGTVEELLVRHDLTTIETAALDQETLDAVERVLESRGKHIERVEQPRQRLEQLFLDIVAQAQREGAVTSGASNTGRIAQFLTAAGAAGPDGQALIDQLVTPPSAPLSPSAVAAPTATKPEPTQTAVIDALTRAESSPPLPPPPTPATARKSAEKPGEMPKQDRADLSVIDDLLGGPSGKQ
jgi:ABC-2 type transport system ATP-binding protein